MRGDHPTEVRKTRPIPRDTKEQLGKFQDWYPDTRSDLPPDTFEIGLVLAGAVSAGAYTAGVMDFLFEALDEWYKLRNGDNSENKLPNHNVVLRVISGASAGGINGAIAAAACRYHFLPVTLETVDTNGSQNPFFNTWGEGIDIRRLLDPYDLKEESSIRSLLNSEAPDELALAIVNMPRGSKAAPKAREWLENPFKLLLTITNLRGVPCEVRFTGGTQFGHEMVLHRDHVGFSVPVLTSSTPVPDPTRPQKWYIRPLHRQAGEAANHEH